MDEENRAPAKLDIANLAEVAQWLAQFVAVSAISGVIGNAAYDTLRSIKRRFGRKQVEELKARVLEALRTVKHESEVSEADLKDRVEAIFRDYEHT
jgi:hypothetical protein